MDLVERLSKYSKRVTRERLAIFDFIKKHHIFTASSIYQEFAGASRSSIFRSLKVFLEIGLIRRINIGERGTHYEVLIDCEHHEHMKCRSCGDVISFDSENICTKIFKEAKKIGFHINEHSVNIIGICKQCKN